VNSFSGEFIDADIFDQNSAAPKSRDGTVEIVDSEGEMAQSTCLRV